MNNPGALSDIYQEPEETESLGDTSGVENSSPLDSSYMKTLVKKYGPWVIGALMLAHGLTRKPAQAPGLPASFASPLPKANFNPKLLTVGGDYYTYGTRPQQSFYQGANLPTIPGKARGGALSQTGSRYYPEGPGSGRDDQLDAKLSPKEYVMDAETVSMLGDGNPDEGAKRLDQMRQKLRQHKGKVLAKGKFSPNAKNPEAYLKGAKV